MSNMPRKVILADMDDTVTHLIEPWVEWLDMEHGLNVNPNCIIDWDICKFFPSLTRDEVFKPLHTPSFWETVTPKDGAYVCLKLLKEVGFKVYICTNSHYDTIKPKIERALLEHFDYLFWDDVIVTNRKQIVSGDYLVDDKLSNLVGGSYRGILMSAPHNWWLPDEALSVSAPRVNDWYEATSIILKGEVQ